MRGPDWGGLERMIEGNVILRESTAYIEPRRTFMLGSTVSNARPGHLGAGAGDQVAPHARQLPQGVADGQARSSAETETGMCSG
jgi:hypothetical protein